MRCWQGWWIAEDHEPGRESDHVDVTGYSWSEDPPEGGGRVDVIVDEFGLEGDV